MTEIAAHIAGDAFFILVISLVVSLAMGVLALIFAGMWRRTRVRLLAREQQWAAQQAEIAAREARCRAGEAQCAATEGRANRLDAILDALPVPIWLRGQDGALTWCNRAYARAVDAPPDAVVREGRELTGARLGVTERVLASGFTHSEHPYVVIDGARRRFKVVEAPLAAGQQDGARIIGYALDDTEEDALHSALARHQAAQAEMLEHMGSAIAVFGADTRLKFFNQAYVRLGDFNESWLNTGPGYGEILEDLRQRRRLPETADFPLYKKKQLALFTSLLTAREEMMYLPDGTTVRVLVVPHPLGGLLFVLEDVTNTLALQTSYNTLMAVQQEAFDNLAEGIAVFGGDGRLKLSNPAYARIWHLAEADVAGEPHIAALTECMKPLFNYGDEWDAFKDDIVGSTLDRALRQGRLERRDSSVIDFSTMPLPDGAVLINYLEVTDSVRVEQALRTSNTALEAADRFKSDFIINTSFHLRTPLNALLGFAQMLSGEWLGPLTPRQREAVQTILSSGTQLVTLIDDIAALDSGEPGTLPTPGPR